jgi:hypothetical protein
MIAETLGAPEGCVQKPMDAAQRDCLKSFLCLLSQTTLGMEAPRESPR